MRALLAFAAGCIVSLVSVQAVSGLVTDNHTVTLHRQAGWSGSEAWFNIHHGAISLDATSPPVTASEYDDLRDAAGISQSAFDSEAAGLLGSWWTARDTTERQNFRQVLIDACE